MKLRRGSIKEIWLERRAKSKNKLSFHDPHWASKECPCGLIYYFLGAELQVKIIVGNGKGSVDQYPGFSVKGGWALSLRLCVL